MRSVKRPLRPPQLTFPRTSRALEILLLYLSVIKDVVGSMLAQEDNGKNERVMYYLSKRLHYYENRYTPIEKSFFALVWAV